MTGVQTCALPILWAWTGRAEFERAARRMADLLGGQAQQMPQAYAQALIALDEWLGPRREIVLAGSADDPDVLQMRRIMETRFLPRTEVVARPADPAEAKALEALVPWTAGRVPASGKASAYICESQVCGLPVTEVETLKRAVEAWR